MIGVTLNDGKHFGTNSRFDNLQVVFYKSHCRQCFQANTSLLIRSTKTQVCKDNLQISMGDVLFSLR